MEATTMKEAKKQVKDARKQGNGTIGCTDDTLEASVGVLGTLHRRQLNWHRQMNRRTTF
jgi:hypothetical protein